MIDTILEIATNLYYSFLFIIFLYLMFDRKYKKRTNIIIMLSATAVMFVCMNWFLFNRVVAPFYIDSLTYILIMIAYALLSLKGNLLMRIFMPVFAFSINNVLSYFIGFCVSSFTGDSYEELVQVSSLNRYMCIIVIAILNALVYYIVYNLNIKNKVIINRIDFIPFVLIPLLAMTIVICSECILYVSDNVGGVLPFLITIMVSMIVITLFTWFMVTKISRANKIKTEMLLMQKQTELYEKNILETNEQIQKFTQSKHEMNKALLLIRGLLNEKDYKGIDDFCENKSSEIMNLHTLINSDNPSLNAVINVEASKAIQRGITLIANIYDSMKEIEKSDLMSVIGNMCDNAIEYLARNEDIADRRIRLEVSKSYNMYTIECKNTISGSVLAENPELLTTKKDTNNHGLGISIIKDIVNKYSGQIEIKEDEEYFIITALLMVP